jgi:hypothetical protein
MTWTEHAPDAILTLDQAVRAAREPSCRTVLAGYAALMADLPQGQPVPAKNGIDLSAFSEAMPDLALCAIEGDTRCVYRLVGDRLRTRLGFNPVGQNYYDFVPDVRRAHAAHAMTMVVRTPMAFGVGIEQHYSSGEILLVEAVAVPLASDERGVDGFILFADVAVNRWSRLSQDGVRLLGANVARRDLIDLGYGVDTGFRDLVRVQSA